MKVLVVAETLWPCGGGGELATYLYARGLLEHGIDVKVLAGRACSFNGRSGFDVYATKLLGRGKFSIPTWDGGKVVEKLFRWADVIYFISMFNLIPLAVRLGRPAIVHIHSYIPVCPIGHMHNFVRGVACNPVNRDCFRCILLYELARRPLDEALSSALLNKTFNSIFVHYILTADKLIFVSHAQKELYLKHLSSFYPRVQIRYNVIYNPLPKLDVHPIEGDNVCYWGGLDPIKGFKDLFVAWLKLYKRFTGSRLFAAMTNRLAGRVERVNVVSLPKLYGSKLEAVYKLCRVVVVPSICPEPSPYVAVEALLRGRLFIASRVGGIPEIASGSPGVRLAEPGDVDGLADALEWALSMDRSEAVELGLRNREHALERFDSERSVRELISVFERLI